MTRFAEAMRFVEEAHAFPARAEDVHGERFRALLEEAELVEPLSAIPTVVVAGSAGKASTARMIASIARLALDRAGDRRPVVLGTKPPLSETPDGNRERYQILRHGADLGGSRRDGEPGGSDLASAWADAFWITREAFAAQVDALREPAARVAARGAPLAPYDLRYAVLARLAVTEGAALCVVEANIGLRRDVAGRWPNPRVHVLTRVGVEHASLLQAPGDFVARHGPLGGAAGPLWHKASGTTPGSVVVIGEQAAAIAPIAAQLVRGAGAREILEVAEQTALADVETSIEGSRATLTLAGETMSITLAALGDYQLANARTAALACLALNRDGQLPAPYEAIADGLARVVVPGRLELVDRAPPTLLNVTEGASKVHALLAAVRALGATRFVVCASVLSRVDGAAEIVRALASAPETQAFVAAAHGPSDVPASTVAAWARAEIAAVHCEPDPRRAVARARVLAGSNSTVLLVGNGLSDALRA